MSETRALILWNAAVLCGMVALYLAAPDTWARFFIALQTLIVAAVVMAPNRDKERG